MGLLAALQGCQQRLHPFAQGIADEEIRFGIAKLVMAMAWVGCLYRDGRLPHMLDCAVAVSAASAGKQHEKHCDYDRYS
jgi:hypothetical protein